ncbi:RDD family protein [Microbacterium sp. NC79]|uniref:RDD family protein n=1 Tax=Microbacterium sp. NC79 TaxID=2851009 RepID=UPI001C2C3EF8|nr:RDD family protein [Microbacterium sp. NC79]
MTNPSAYYPGQDLGLPETGVGSIARFPPRLLALIIDWIPVTILSIAFFDYSPLAQMLIFFAINVVFVPTLGGTPGHRIVGMRVLRLDGAWTGVVRPIVRTVLILLVIPAVVWDQDQRGLHDKISGTMLVRAPGIFRR